MSSSRTFKTVHVAAPGQDYKSKTKFNPGRYTGEPQAAAKKAFGRLCKDKKIKGVCTFVITMKESTQGSAKGLYSYRLSRKKLTKPIKVTYPGGVEVVYKYSTVVKPLDTNSVKKKVTAGRGRSVKKLAMPKNIYESLMK